MKRFVSFIVSVILLVTLGVMGFLLLNQPEVATYQQTLREYEWFHPTLLSLFIVSVVIAFAILIFSLSPSYKKRGLYLKFDDGEIYMNKKSIEKNVQHTLAKYDDVRQPSIDVTLYQKKHASYVDIHVNMLMARTEQVQTLLETIRNDLKESTEHFSELPVREVSLNVLDQKALNQRVL